MKIYISESASVSFYSGQFTIDSRITDIETSIELPFEISDDILYDSKFPRELVPINKEYAARLDLIKASYKKLVEALAESLIADTKILVSKYENLDQ